MSKLPNCLLIVTAEVDAEVEADWSRWYDEVHLPDALACPGVLAGRRYASVGEISESDRGQGRRTSRKLWTTVYELDSPAAVETKEFKAMRGWSKFASHVRSQTRVVSSLRAHESERPGSPRSNEMISAAAPGWGAGSRSGSCRA